VTPTVGFQKEAFKKRKTNFTVLDMSGQGQYRSMWEQFGREVQAVIFVVDSSDRFRFVVAREELEILLKSIDSTAPDTPVLIFANKMDAEGAVDPKECSELLGLSEMDGTRPWHIASSDALTGAGISGGIEWLCDEISRGKAAKMKK
jgi:ADP-ribosylation factor-like protein 6